MKQSTHARIHKRIIRAVGVTTAVAVLVPAVSMPEGLRAAAATQGNATKSESVYVNVDATGKTEQEIVSDWIHDDTSGATVADQSRMTDITNVKGTEKPQISGSSVTWTLSGNDLYYQGKTTQSLPVSMTVQYFIDGKSVTPSELAGQSGKFEMKLSFRNLDAHSVTIGGQNKTVYTPFVCLAAFDLPSKTFTNVTTNFGTVISDGSNQAVSFLGFPGLKQSFDMLDFSSVDLPDELDVTADVKDFSLGPIMMAATPVPDMDSLKNTSDLSGLTDKLQQLIDAGVQLKDATGQLSAGEAAFSDGVSQLLEGIGTAGASFDQIVSGAQALSSGASDEQSGIPALISGANSLSSGASQVSGGLDQLFAQFPALQSSVGQLNGGAQQIADGIGQLLGQFTATGSAQSPTAVDSADALSAGAAQYAELANNTLFNMAEANLQALQSALTKALSSNPTAIPGAVNDAVSAELADLHGGADAAIIQYCAATSDTAKAAYLQQATGYINLYDALHVIATDPTILSLAGQSKTQDAEAEYEKQMSSASSAYFYSFDFTQSNLDTYLKAAGLDTATCTALEQTAAGIQQQGVDINGQIVAPINQQNIVIVGNSVSSGASQLAAALSTTVHQALSNLNTGAQTLKSGTGQLAAQIQTSGDTANPTLYDAVASLDAGAKQLASGAQTLASGASGLKTLESGIGSLTSALSLFRGGLSTIQTGASTLNDSSKQLASGAAALNSGMTQFWGQGLSQLQSIDTGKINQALAVKDEMIRLADAYTSFCGTGSDVKSSVKFIVKTDEIKTSTRTATQTVSTSSAKNTSVWQKIGKWLRGLFRAD